jgi:hypothetical protein
LNQTFQRLQQAEKQLISIQPLVSTIGQELIDLELSGLSRVDLQNLQNALDTHRQRMNR